MELQLGAEPPALARIREQRPAIGRDIGGASVDVLTPNALPDSYREAVLAEATPV